MASKTTRQITFDIDKIIQPIYTGGDVDVDGQGRILASCIGEEALLTEIATGKTLARIEGVRLTDPSFSTDSSHS